jgi:hypothetical protein
MGGLGGLGSLVREASLSGLKHPPVSTLGLLKSHGRECSGATLRSAAEYKEKRLSDVRKAPENHITIDGDL